MSGRIFIFEDWCSRSSQKHPGNGRQEGESSCQIFKFDNVKSLQKNCFEHSLKYTPRLYSLIASGCDLPEDVSNCVLRMF